MARPTRILNIDNYRDKFPSEKRWKYQMYVDQSYRENIFNISNYKNRFKRNISDLEADASEKDIHQRYLYARGLGETEFL